MEVKTKKKMEAKKRKPLSNCTNTITTRNSNSSKSSNPAKPQLKSPNLSKSTFDDVFPEKHVEFNTSVRSNTANSQLKSPNLSKSTFDDVFPAKQIEIQTGVGSIGRKLRSSPSVPVTPPLRIPNPLEMDSEKHIEFHTGDGSIGPKPRSSPSVPVTPPLRIPNPSSTDSVSGKPLIEYTRRQSADKTKAKGKMVAPPLSCPPAKRTRYFRDNVGDAVLSKSCEMPRKRMELEIMKTPSTFKMPEKYKHLNTSPNVESDTSIGLKAMNPTTSPSVPSTPLLHKSNPSSTDSGLGNPLIECTSRLSADKRKEKGKMVAAPSSCPPVERNRYFRDDVGDVQVSKSCTIPCKRKHRGSQQDIDDHAYFEQQRAYFAEIDAFELTEETASENDSV